MTFVGGTTTARSIVPRLVRKTVADFAWSTAFSKQHFPKTLAGTCLVSFTVGFLGMNQWQRNRQLEWEKRQEEMEAEFFKTHAPKK